MRIHFISLTAPCRWLGVSKTIADTDPLPQGWVMCVDEPQAGDCWRGYGKGWAPATAASPFVDASTSDALKAKRDSLCERFTWDGSEFQLRNGTDDAANILGAVLTAQSGQWPQEGVAWRLADNSWRTLSASDIVAVFAAGTQRKSAAFAAFAADEVHQAAGGTGTPNMDALS